MKGLSLRGKRAIRYLVIEPHQADDAQDGLGKVVSRHNKLSAAKRSLEKAQLECRLRGTRCHAYIYDVQMDRAE